MGGVPAHRASGELHEKRTTAFKIADGDQRSTVMGMLWLWRWRWESAEPVDPPVVDVPTVPSQPVVPPAQPTAPPAQPEPTPSREVSAPIQPESGVSAATAGNPLSELTNVTGQTAPQTMVFPDGSTKSVGKWNRLQAAAVEWLVETGRLNESDCPLTNSRRTHLVHTSPYRRDGKRFTQPAPIGQFWIDGHASAHNHVSRAKDILDAAGVDPATIFVSS